MMCSHFYENWKLTIGVRKCLSFLCLYRIAIVNQVLLEAVAPFFWRLSEENFSPRFSGNHALFDVVISFRRLFEKLHQVYGDSPSLLKSFVPI